MWRASASKRRCVSSHCISPPNLSLVHHDCTIQQLLQPKKPETRRPNLKPGRHRLTMWRASASKRRCVSSNGVSSAEFISESSFKPPPQATETRVRNTTQCADDASSESKRRCVSSHRISPPNLSLVHHDCTIQQLLQPKKPETKRPNLKPGRHRLTMWRASASKRRCVSSNGVSSAEFISESSFKPPPQATETRVRNTAQCADDASSESKQRCVSSHRISPPNLSLVHHDCTIQQLLQPKKPETKRPNLKPGRHRLTMWRASASKRRCVSSNGVSSAEFISESSFKPPPQATETRARNATPCADDASSESKRRCVSSHRISPPNLSLVHHDCTIQQLLQPKKPETRRPNLKPGRHRLTMWRTSASKLRCDRSRQCTLSVRAQPDPILKRLLQVFDLLFLQPGMEKRKPS